MAFAPHWPSGFDVGRRVFGRRFIPLLPGRLMRWYAYQHWRAHWRRNGYDDAQREAFLKAEMLLEEEIRSRGDDPT